MAVGFDYGTSILVVARKNEEGKVEAFSERNCFLDVSIDAEDMLAGSNYIKDEENGEERLYVIGKDAIVLANMNSKNDPISGRTSGLRRPMAKMVINSKMEKKAIQMLKYMSQNLIGQAKEEGEICVVSIPANPLDQTFSNTFHENMCLQFISDMGYEAFPITESLAVIYATNPTTTDSTGEELSMTGIGISWGAGGTNGCLAYKGKDTIRFALPKGGDWIDEQVSGVTGFTASEVTVRKERSSRENKLDLSKEPDGSDDVISAMYIFYKALIDEVAKNFKAEFVKQGTYFEEPIEVVVSGGTSMPKGFEDLLKDRIERAKWPFEIKGVRKAKDPLRATAIGCLNAATSKEKKKNE